MRKVNKLAYALLAIFLGLLGLTLGLALILWYLCTIDSFGVPYASPMAEGGFRDTLRAYLGNPDGDVPEEIERKLLNE